MLRNDTHNVDLSKEQGKVDDWFSAFIDNLKTDHLLLSTSTASEEKTKFYNAAVSGDEWFMASEVRKSSSVFFIKRLIYDYLTELENCGRTPLKLALGLSESKILVWSEIQDGDEAMEDALLLTEAKINGKYRLHGFYVNSTIIEASDQVDVPSHYQNMVN